MPQEIKNEKEIVKVEEKKKTKAEKEIVPDPTEKPEDIEEQEKELMEQVSEVTKIKLDPTLTAHERFAQLKVAVRSVLLRKSKQGYGGRYSYIPLKNIQAVFTRLELAFGITSRYTQKRVVNEFGVFYDAVRTAFDLKTGKLIEETEIDITDLVLNKIDPKEAATYDYLREVLSIAEPKDASAMVFLNYFDPQKKGAFSTYFQRYTYFQLYDFQEVDYDDIEESKKDDKNKPVVKKSKEGTKPSKGFKKEETAKEETAKEKRESTTEVAEMRREIKDQYGREKITAILGPERKLSTMNLEELLGFKEELKDAYEKEKGEE